MSRSVRKNPIVRQCSKNSSEKFYKRLRSSKERRSVKNRLKSGDYDLLRFQLIIFDEWQTNRDGKMILDKETIKKWPELAKLLRK